MLIRLHGIYITNDIYTPKSQKAQVGRMFLTVILADN